MCRIPAPPLYTLPQGESQEGLIIFLKPFPVPGKEGEVGGGQTVSPAEIRQYAADCEVGS